MRCIVRHCLFAFITWAACTGSPRISHAQQPAYFILGEKEFQGLQVYDVIQDTEQNYLFSTNEGIHRYDYNRFEKIGCPEAKSTAAFNFVRNRKGVIYCCNLNHQIFRIQDGQCTLVYELKEDEVSPDLSLAIGPNDELLASARKILALDGEGKVNARFGHRNTFWGQPFKTQHGAVIYHLPRTDSLLQVDESGFSWQVLKVPQGEPVGVCSFFRIRHQPYAVDLASKALYALDEKNLSLVPQPAIPAFERSKSLRIYEVGDHTWIAGTLPGAFCLNHVVEGGKYPLFYEHHFISDILQDHEGNILLSTFDNGILVVPNLNIPDVIHQFRDDPVTALYMDTESNTLYMGSSKGKLMQYKNGEITTLGETGMRAIHSIYGREGFPYLIYDDGMIRALEKEKGEALDLAAYVLKDAVVLDTHKVYLGTNMGLFQCSWDRRGMATLTAWPEFAFRIHFLEREGLSKNVVASTARGLFRIDAEGKSEKILLHGKDIFPTALAPLGEKVMAATQQDGILVLEGGAVTAQIRPKQVQNEYFAKLLVHKNTLLAKSAHSIYQLGMEGEVRNNISKAYGLPARIFDIALQDSLLWVSHAGGVQAVNLGFSAVQGEPLQLRIAQIAVNDSQISPLDPATFASDQRKFKFVVAAPSLRHKESLRIHYQLQGYDSDWMAKPNDGTPIVYNALAPGAYTFVAKVEHQGRMDAPVAYRFEIAAPYYARWWFIVAVSLAALGAVVLVFKLQLNAQRKKARQINELNASKLTAIQSQMNPHFIFNALNSIQDLVLKGDVQNSYSFITIFSNLVRSTLSNSEKDFIDFDQEIKLLQLYLTLEQLRFKNDLHYAIETGEIDDIQLPPLLIQPFVENALLHGLLHKTGEKRLSIKFELKEMLICTIEDNGIGRVRAKAIRERQRLGHESFSGKAIRKRFDILSDVFRGKFGYRYEDLMAEGQAVGTRVILSIPVRRQF